MKHLRFVLACIALAVAAWSSPILAGPKIEIIIGPDAPKLTRFAADEMSGQLKTLFDADVKVINSASPDATDVILLGQPDTNPALAKAIGADWPKLSEQGILLKSTGPAEKRMLVVGGGSPVATLWAAYELGHRYGIRYMLSGDALPAKPAQFTLDKYDVLLEPTLKTRGWQLLGGYLANAWGLEDQQRLIRQLAKLKFNHIVLTLNATGPFFTTSTTTLFHGQHFPVDGGTPGRKAFKGAKEFNNPDFVGKTNPEGTTAVAQRLVKGLIDTAHELGMTVGIRLSNVSHNPDGSLDARNATQGQIQECLKEYPLLDVLYLHDSLRMNKEFLESLTTDRTPARGQQRLEFVFVDPDLSADQGSALSNEAWYCHSIWPLFPPPLFRLKGTSLPRTRTTVVLPSLSFAGLLPNVRQRLTHGIVSELRTTSWHGFQVSGAIPGDLDPIVHYLARASFDATATPDSVCHELFDTLCGNAEVTNRLIKGFDYLGQANEKFDRRPLWGRISADADCLKDLGEPSSNLMAISRETTYFYLQAMNEMFRAHDNCHPASRNYVYYYARRCEFAFQYMTFVQALAAAEEAKAKKDTEGRLDQLGKAVEALYNALNSLGDVARDQSDRGTIAILTEFAYRPLVKQLDKETEDAEKGQ